jgi:hypothetical protein
VQGTFRRKVALILLGLLVLAAIVCGVGYFVFIRDDGDNKGSSTSNASPSSSSSAFPYHYGFVKVKYHVSHVASWAALWQQRVQSSASTTRNAIPGSTQFLVAQKACGLVVSVAMVCIVVGRYGSEH